MCYLRGGAIRRSPPGAEPRGRGRGGPSERRAFRRHPIGRDRHDSEAPCARASLEYTLPLSPTVLVGLLVVDAAGDLLDRARTADLFALVELASRRGQNPVADRAHDLLLAIVRSGDLHATQG
jgi:hypothetical protein